MDKTILILDFILFLNTYNTVVASVVTSLGYFLCCLTVPMLCSVPFYLAHLDHRYRGMPVFLATLQKKFSACENMAAVRTDWVDYNIYSRKLKEWIFNPTRRFNYGIGGIVRHN